MSKENMTYKYCLLILVQCLCNSFGPPFTKLIYESVSINWYMAIRFSLASIMLFLFFGRRITDGWKGKKIFRFVPLYVCTLFGYYLTNIALQYTSSINVGFIISLPVVIAPIMERLLYKRMYSAKHIPVLCLAVFGLFLLAFNGFGVRLALGDIVALLAATALAGTLVLGERASRQIDAIALLTPSMVLTAGVSLVLALGMEGTAGISSITAGAWAGLIYLAVIGSVFVTYLTNKALKYISSTMVSGIQAVQPVMTALISFILLKEVIGITAMLGAAIVVGAVIMDNVITVKCEL